MCECCTTARACDGYYRVFDPACLWCGARYFQLLRSWPAIKVASRAETKEERQAWRSTVLATWKAQGHDMAKVLALAAAKDCPLKPIKKGR